jgi:hypothetical protein
VNNGPQTPAPLFLATRWIAELTEADDYFFEERARHLQEQWNRRKTLKAWDEYQALLASQAGRQRHFFGRAGSPNRVELDVEVTRAPAKGLEGVGIVSGRRPYYYARHEDGRLVAWIPRKDRGQAYDFVPGTLLTVRCSVLKHDHILKRMVPVTIIGHCEFFEREPVTLSAPLPPPAPSPQ